MRERQLPSPGCPFGDQPAIAKREPHADRLYIGDPNDLALSFASYRSLLARVEGARRANSHRMHEGTAPSTDSNADRSLQVAQAITHPRLPLSLTGEQIALYDAFAVRDARLSAMYLGARLALSLEENPQRIVHAAHSMRELLEKIPRYLRAPVVRTGPDLKARVTDFVDRFELAKKRSGNHRNGRWEGEIDENLRTLLRYMEEFKTGFKQDYPSRREQMMAAIQSIDPLAGHLPTAIEETLINEWKAHDRFFKRVAHHDQDVEPSTFEDQMGRCERFLLTRLRPSSVETQRALDAIIAEGEAGV